MPRPASPQRYAPSAPPFATSRPGAADITFTHGRPTIDGWAIIDSRTRFADPFSDAKVAIARAIDRSGTAKVGALQPSRPRPIFFAATSEKRETVARFRF